MHKRASLRTGGSALTSARKKTRKTTAPHDYRVAERNLRLKTERNRKKRALQRRGMRRKRRKWVTYVADCIQADTCPINLPQVVKAEIKVAGSLRAWVASCAPRRPSSN